MSTESTNREPFLVIEPPRHWLEVRLGELWQYRDLLLTLSWRDIQVRYKQTVLGAAWAVVQPLAGMIVFTLVFSKMAKLANVLLEAMAAGQAIVATDVYGTREALPEGATGKIVSPGAIVDMSDALGEVEVSTRLQIAKGVYEIRSAYLLSRHLPRSGQGVEWRQD